MAVRKRLYHPDEVRAKIQTSQLINRLIACGMGEIDLSPQQLGAIKILLAKVLPDLASVEHTGEIKHSFAIEVPAPSATVESWTQTQVPRLQ